MTLLDVRKKFVDKAGRHELVVDWENADFDDNGANDVINDGIRWLNEQRKALFDIISSSDVGVLVDDTDTNWWTLNHPHIVINAARRMLELEQRNETGRRDWDGAIISEIALIYQNQVNANVQNGDYDTAVMNG